METNLTNNTTDAIIAEGVGIAYHAVAQSTAIAIQDAVENLRNINTVALTMIGAASAQSLSDPASVDQMQKVIEMAQQITLDAVTNLSNVGAAATNLLKGFPVQN
jgi:hypothetical protein